MAGAATLFDNLAKDAPAADVNACLQACLDDISNSYHVWFRYDGRRQIKPTTTRRRSGDSGVDAWQRVIRRLILVPSYLRTWGHDEETVRLLHRLALHPADPVRLPAAVALATLGLVPPLATIDDLREQRGFLYANRARPPRWWGRLAVRYRAVRWESLCVRLAEAVHGEAAVLAGMRGETTCYEGIIPDIIVGPVRYDDAGLVEYAEMMIDAKSGSLPREHKYIHRCDRMEYWHAGTLGEWVKRGGDGDCEIIYRDRDELAELAPPALRAQIEEFTKTEHSWLLYLRFLEDRATTAMTEDELAPTLEDPYR